MLFADLVELGQRRVERRRLAAARGAGDQHHAERLVDRLFEVLEGRFLEAELRHVELQVRLVEEPEHDLLAEHGRKGGDAEVHLLVAGELHLDAAVLRQAALGDVELRHDLEARGDGVLEPQRRLHHLVQHAVDAEPDAERLLVRLDVDVAGALADGVGQDGVHELHDRGFLGRFLQLAQVDVVVVLDQLDVLVAELREHLVEVRVVVVVAVDGGRDRGRRCHGDLHVVAGQELDLVDGDQVRRVGHDERQRVAREAGRDQVVFHHQRLGYEAEDVLRDVERRGIDDREAVLPLEDRQQILLGDEVQLDQVIGEGARARAGPRGPA